MPLWQPNDYFWDGDVIPEGGAGGVNLKGVGLLDITLQGGSFVIEEGGWDNDTNTE